MVGLKIWERGLLRRVVRRRAMRSLSRRVPMGEKRPEKDRRGLRKGSATMWKLFWEWIKAPGINLWRLSWS